MKAGETPASGFAFPGEEWRPAIYCRDLREIELTGYQVSNLGRVANSNRLVATHRNPQGLVMACFGRYPNGKQRQLPVGRVVKVSFDGPPPSPGLAVFYRDGDHTNLRPDNLGWGRHVRGVHPGGSHWFWEQYS